MLRGMTLSHRDWTVLNEARHQIRWKWHEYFQTYDLMLTPATMMTAIHHTETPPYERSVVIDGIQRPFMNQIWLPGYSNFTYLPTTVAPIGFASDGLPSASRSSVRNTQITLFFAGLLEQHFRVSRHRQDLTRQTTLNSCLDQPNIAPSLFSNIHKSRLNFEGNMVADCRTAACPMACP